MVSTSISPDKSTNGRFWGDAQPWQQLLFRLLPGVSASLLARRFLTPRRREAALQPDGAQQITLSCSSVPVVAQVWGQGPLVILCHGWCGGAAQVVPMGRRLVAEGFSVAAFDAPAHGGSQGRSTNVGEFTRCIEELAHRLGPVHAIVGHSLGALAAALANQRSVRAQGVALLAPMPSFEFALDQFQLIAGFDDVVREKLATNVERIARVRRQDADLHTLLADSTPALLVHDTDDRSVPVSHARELAANLEQVEYIETRGLGHKRLLNNDAIINRLIAFVVGLEAPRSDTVCPTEFARAAGAVLPHRHGAHCAAVEGRHHRRV